MANKSGETKLVLKQPISLDELYELMIRNKTAFPGNFSLKKSLFGDSIDFDIRMNLQPRITVKNTNVTLKAIARKNKSTVKVGVCQGSNLIFCEIIEKAENQKTHFVKVVSSTKYKNVYKSQKNLVGAAKPKYKGTA